MTSPLRFWCVCLPLVLTMACGSDQPSGPTPPPTPPHPSTPVSVQAGAAALGAAAFNPNPVDVSVGTTLTWTNGDSVAHTSTANDSAWNSGAVAPGGHFSFTFSTTGTFAYHCTIHPGMVGTVNVH